MTLLHSPQIFGIGLEIFFFLTIIATPIYFVWSWIFKKLIKVKLKRVIISIFATLISTLLICRLLVFAFLNRDDTEFMFTRDKWMNNKSVRYKYSDAIIRSEELIGYSKKRVRDTLGKEDSASVNDSSWYYLLDNNENRGKQLEIKFTNDIVYFVKVIQ